MSESKLIDDQEQVSKFFREIVSDRYPILLWQQGEDNQRELYHVMAYKIDEGKKAIEFRAMAEGKLHFNVKQDIYGHSRNLKIIFRTQIKNTDETHVSLALPSGIVAVDYTVDDSGQILEVESEEKFAHLREVPRARAEGNQEVFIRTQRGDEVWEDTYVLFDLSQGGAALLVYQSDLFQAGDRVELLKLNGKKMGKSLKGEVRSVRLQEDSTIEYKVGIQFE